MPELPEVETIVRDLNKKVLGRKIKDVWSDIEKLKINPAFFKKRAGQKSKIVEASILNIERRGKNILFYLSGGKILLIHQKMTGHLLYGKWKIKQVSSFPARQAYGTGKFPRKTSLRDRQVSSLLKGPLEDQVNNYIHFILYLDNGWQVALSDLRKFAKVAVFEAETADDIKEIKNLGPDALKIKFLEFVERVLAEKREIKKVLMDQEVIAGIGNIYSDDILWLAEIHPSRKSYTLNEEELGELFGAMRNILKKAVKKRGTSISDFRDSSGKKGGYGEIRLVYRRAGEPCRRCNTKIERFKIGGRTSCYCPQCQK